MVQWPREYLLVPFGLERQLLSSRIAVEERNGELLEWLTQAYQFCQAKGSRH